MPNTSDNEFPLFDECKRLYDLSRQLIDSEDIFAQYKAEHPNYHEEDLEYIKLKENVLLNKHQIKTCIFTILRLVAQNYQFQKNPAYRDEDRYRMCRALFWLVYDRQGVLNAHNSEEQYLNTLIEDIKDCVQNNQIGLLSR